MLEPFALPWTAFGVIALQSLVWCKAPQSLVHTLLTRALSWRQLVWRGEKRATAFIACLFVCEGFNIWLPL